MTAFGVRISVLLIAVCTALCSCDDGAGSVTPPVGDAATTRSDPVVSEPTSVRSDDPREALFLGFSAPKPPTWIWHPPDGRMRAANFVVPGRDGNDAAQIVVFYFPPGEGGTVDANIERWTLQFRGPDETRVEPTIGTIQTAGMPVTVVELAGAWMKPGTGWFTEGQRFICAVFEAPIGMVFIRFAGDDATVRSNRETFLQLVRGLKVVE